MAFAQDRSFLRKSHLNEVSRRVLSKILRQADNVTCSI